MNPIICMDDSELEKSVAVMEDFTGYVYSSKLYNLSGQYDVMPFKDVLKDLKKKSRDISDIFSETELLYSYIDAISAIDTNSPDRDLAVRTVDYWWVANLMKSRHNDLKSYSYMKSECLSYYAEIRDKQVIDCLNKYLADILPKKQSS